MNTDTELLQEEALGAKLIKKGSRGYFFMILIAPVGYIIKVLVSNALSVEEIGIFYSVLGLIVLLSSYNDLGLTEALMYFLPNYWIEKKYNEFKTIWYITLGTQLIS
jgi:O-antigen/teichoic acid export membrane protein